MAKSIVNLSDNLATWVSKTNTTVNRVGDLANLTTTTDSDLVGAINEIDSDRSALVAFVEPTQSLTTTATTLADAVNEHDAELGTISSIAMGTTASTVSGAIAELDGRLDSNDTFIGTHSLNTTATTITGAINENEGRLDSNDTFIGAHSLDTAASTITGGINELDARIDSNDTDFNSLVGRETLTTTATTVRGAINEHETQINSIDSDLGTRTSLITNDKTDIVTAINEIKSQVILLDSNDQDFNTRARSAFSASGDLTYDSATGVFSVSAGVDSAGIRSIFSAGGSLTYDSSIGRFSITNETIQDAVGAMFSGNTETGITVTYQDASDTTDFVVNATLGTHTVGDYVATIAASAGTGLSVTGSGSETAAVTIAGVDATTSSKGVASFNSSDFSVSSGAVSLAKDPVITLTGAVTGSGTMTNLGSVSISTTATSDPTLTLSGDVTGSATFTNLGNATLSASLAANTVTSSELSGAVSLIIYNSAGTAVKTLYGAGS